jgi:predicted lactoylglutathione lyase
MELGAFSISLSVKDLEASRAFYEKFGFKPFGGDPSQNWLIMKNGDHVIGLFQAMFEKNILTFNPGWDSNAKNSTVSRTCANYRGFPFVMADRSRE